MEKKIDQGFCNLVVVLNPCYLYTPEATGFPHERNPFFFQLKNHDIFIDNMEFKILKM